MIKFPQLLSRPRRRRQHTCVHVDVKANKLQIKQARKILHEVEVVKVEWRERGRVDQLLIMILWIFLAKIGPSKPADLPPLKM